jgi:hypothetical protein
MISPAQSSHTPPPPTPEPEGAVSLVLVVFLFIFCNTLGLVVNVLESAGVGRLLGFLIDVSNLLVVLNATLNFIIYFTTTQSFRRVFMHHCCGSRWATGRQR